MIREKTSEYFKILKRDKRDWYRYFVNDYRITNLKFINMYMAIEHDLKKYMENLTRPLVDSSYQDWNRARVQLKSDLNYLLDHLKLYIDYYEGDNKILFFGGVAKNDFYYIEIPGFYYIGIDLVGYYKKYGNFNMHLDVIFHVLRTQFVEYIDDELKFIALKVIENSNRNVNFFNKQYLPKNDYDPNYITKKYTLKKSF